MSEDRLFTLRYRLGHGGRCTVTIHAFHTGCYEPRGTSRIALRVLLRADGRTRVIFPTGQLWYSPGPMHSDDGRESRRVATDMVGMRKGDTDAEYFAGYTEEQLDFADRFGEELTMLAEERYGQG